MVYIILGTGFEDMEAICPCDILRRGGVEVQFAGIGGKLITGGNGVTVQADCTVEEIDFDKLEMIVLPGGMGGVLPASWPRWASPMARRPRSTPAWNRRWEAP